MTVICERCGKITQTREIKWMDSGRKFSANVCQDCYKELESKIQKEPHLKRRAK